MLHRNARLTVHGRRELVHRVCELGLSISQASRELGVSRQTGSKWLARFRSCGEAGLADASSRPRVLRPRIAGRLLRRIVRTRQRQRIGAHQIAWKLGICRSTVCAVLRRLGLSRIRDLEPAAEPPCRYEHEHPGDLLHLDTKKLGRIGAGGGKRFAGPQRARRHRGIGWSCVFVAVDDATRLAYAEELPDERGVTAAAFLERALAFYAAHGIAVRRLLTDNGSCFRSRALRAAVCRAGCKHSFTRPYRPQTNGKAEAFVKLLANSWAYVRPYHDEAQRSAALPGFLYRYNHFRPHGGLDGATPMMRLRLSTT
jgi:transposase InsO family protein